MFETSAITRKDNLLKEPKNGFPQLVVVSLWHVKTLTSVLHISMYFLHISMYLLHICMYLLHICTYFLPIYMYFLPINLHDCIYCIFVCVYSIFACRILLCFALNVDVLRVKQE